MDYINCPVVWQVIRSLEYVFISVLNVIGTWYLLQSYGVAGAAFMTGLSMLIGHGIIIIGLI